MGFAMLERDTVTGLNLAVYREENPGTGRWDTQDPLDFFAFDTNLYRYTFNQPTNLEDKDGEFIWIPIIVIAVLLLNPTELETPGADNVAVLGMLETTVSIVTTVGPRPGGPWCFVAGTLVSTADRLKPIEQVLEGDNVWSHDFGSGRRCLARVQSTTRRRYDGVIVTVDVGGEAILCTANHPFWVSEGDCLDQRPHPQHVECRERDCTLPGRWVDARDLRVGDVFFGPKGSAARIETIASETTIVDVFNLCVAATNNYFVGECEILVHNRPSRGRPERPRRQPTEPPEQPIARPGTRQPGAGRRRGGNWERSKQQIQSDCDDILDKIGEIEQNIEHRPGKPGQRLDQALQQQGGDALPAPAEASRDEEH